MSNMLRVNNFFLTIIILSFFCCNNKIRKKEYEKLEIYCWCFLSDSLSSRQNTGRSIDGKICQTIGKVKPASLMEKKYLYQTISNQIIIQKISEIVFEEMVKSEEITQGPETRFMMIFRETNGKTDTVVYWNKANDLSINSKFRFSYSFNIIDSIKAVLGTQVIDCPSD